MSAAGAGGSESKMAERNCEECRRLHRNFTPGVCCAAPFFCDLHGEWLTPEEVQRPHDCFEPKEPEK